MIHSHIHNLLQTLKYPSLQTFYTPIDIPNAQHIHTHTNTDSENLSDNLIKHNAIKNIEYPLYTYIDLLGMHLIKKHRKKIHITRCS